MPASPVLLEGQAPRVLDVTLDANGPMALASAKGPVSIGERRIDGDGDALVVAFDWDGGVRWAQRLRSPAHVMHEGITVLGDGDVLFVGSFENTLGLEDLESPLRRSRRRGRSRLRRRRRSRSRLFRWCRRAHLDVCRERWRRWLPASEQPAAMSSVHRLHLAVLPIVFGDARVFASSPCKLTRRRTNAGVARASWGDVA